MSKSSEKERADSLVRNPFVLQAAWNKVLDFYRTSENGPSLELKRWSEAPWAHLEELSHKLVNNSEQPTFSCFTRLPYPKPGKEVFRPYCAPTVEAQVAHLVYLVLLAPFLEAQMECFSFGSRLYRPMVRAKDDKKEGYWRTGPFSLSDEKLFTSFRRGYGLFRRVAHWVTCAWLGPNDRHSPWNATTKDDFPDDALPYVSSKYAISNQGTTPRALLYAKLDLKRAYPSASLQLVNNALLRMVVAPFESNELLPTVEWSSDDHLSEPWRLLAKNRKLRVELARRWSKLLDSTESKWEKSAEKLLPKDYDEVLHYGDTGLCTGLAVSPVLLNVLLTDLDKRIVKRWEETGLVDFAYLRFADDIILIWPEEENAGNSSRPNNLPPVLVRDFIKDIFKGELTLNDEKAEPDWVAQYLATGKAEHLKNKRKKITRTNRREFLTHLVEKMSHLHPENLSALVGNDFYSRLREMSELIFLDINDSEVRPDTRMSYAVNRLARTSIAWQNLSEQQHSQVLSALQNAIGTAVKRNPDKFSLWRSALRISLIPAKGGAGINWLESLLGNIADSKYNQNSISKDQPAWQTEWPCEREQLPRDTKAKKAYRLKTSFIRARVLQEFAHLVRELERTQEKHYIRSPMSWHSRLFKGAQLSTRVQSLPEVALRLVRTLFPHKKRAANKAPWEERALAHLLFSFSHSRKLLAEVAGSSLSYTEAQRVLRVTKWSPILSQLSSPHAKSYLRRWSIADLCIQQSVNEEPGVKICFRRLEALLSEARRTGYSRKSVENIETFLANASNFELSKNCTSSQTWQFLHLYQGLRGCALRYSSANLIHGLLKCLFEVLSNGLPSLWRAADKTSTSKAALTPPPSGLVELKRLLWSVPSSKPPLSWLPEPSRCPAIGLPRQTSLRLYQLFLRSNPESSQLCFCEPLLNECSAQTLADFRNYQFYSGPDLKGSQMEAAEEAKFLNTYAFYPHPLVLIGQTISEAPDTRRRWASTCTYLLATSGDETLLDNVWRRFPFGMPPSEQRLLQSITLASDEAWTVIDASFNRKRIINGSTKDVDAAEQLFVNAEFGALVDLEEVVDVKFRESGVRGALAQREPLSRELPQHKSLRVRLAQIDKFPKFRTWEDILHGDFELHIPTLLALERALPETNHTDDSPKLLLVPEVCIPAQFMSPLKTELRSRLMSLIGGQTWQKLPAVAPTRDLKPTLNLILNQALVHLDFSKSQRDGFTFSFNLIKPNPAHTEYSLAKYITSMDSPNQYFFARGHEWYRFCHKTWGPFTVAICSDLLDAAPWSKMKGRLLHLFLVAYNTDVALYDAATWTRAYELYVNLIAVNHGSIGGSLAWSPQHKHDKTIVRLEGAKQFLLADVDLPVHELAEAQMKGKDWAEAKARDQIEKNWFTEKPKKSKFKSIPPGWKLNW